MRVYGSGSNVDQSSDYGIAVSIDVDDNGKPYVVNQRGDTYRRDAPSSWTRLTSIKPRTQVSVSSSNNYQISTISQNDGSILSFNGASWVDIQHPGWVT